MKKIKQLSFALLSATALLIYSCGEPNDDKGSMDQESSGGEGATDSTRMPGFDSTRADSAHASLSGQNIHISTAHFSTAKL